ncbi:MAG: VPLPA-CTERM sorting domain-containing protein [Halioglobus sp.]|nr:VPLPA-CTERM sorting domain-containing protein [Halioglobus sp.]
MKKIIKALTAALVFTGSSGAVNAATIGAADIFRVGDREWAQPDLFTDLSWNDINSVCPAGECMATELNGWYMQGWTWASVTDVGELLSEFTPYAGGFVYDEVDSSWAPAFLELFRPTFSATYANFVAGITRESQIFCCQGLAYTFKEAVLDTLTFTNGGVVDRVSVTRGADYLTTSNHSTGAWMYRDVSPVPLPAAAWLFGSALLGLAGVGRRKTA